MSRKISLINEKKISKRSAVLLQVPIISAFGGRAMLEESDDAKVDAFITGEIISEEKIIAIREKIADAKLDNEKVLALVDPDFAKDGVKYDYVTDTHIANYKKLMEVSDIITPNLSEACFLTDSSYDEYRDKYSTINYDNSDKEKVNELSKKIISTILPLLDKIRFKKNQISIITGIKLYNAILTILDVYDGDHGKRQTTCNYSEKIDERDGAGEIFDAMYFETCTSGFNLIDALSVSTSFVNNSLRYSRDQKIPLDDGIVYEPILHENIMVIRKTLKEKRGEIKC